jgi:hypothetical protein
VARWGSVQSQRQDRTHSPAGTAGTCRAVARAGGQSAPTAPAALAPRVRPGRAVLRGGWCAKPSGEVYAVDPAARLCWPRGFAWGCIRADLLCGATWMRSTYSRVGMSPTPSPCACSLPQPQNTLAMRTAWQFMGSAMV